VSEGGSAVRTLLVLWDVDHTLIENHGVNKETYAEAFRLLTGRDAEHPAQTEGRTEPEIMRNMLIRHGIEPTAGHVARMPEVLATATRLKAAALRDRGHELPGAREALAALQGIPWVIQSVLSGNIRANAFAKLSVFGLDPYIDFEVGGYGSDDEVRDNLVGLPVSARLANMASYLTRARQFSSGIRRVMFGQAGTAARTCYSPGS
jgi:phosphoglycolate phosphatase